MKLNSSAIMLSFIAGPIGVVALRHLLPAPAKAVAAPRGRYLGQRRLHHRHPLVLLLERLGHAVAAPAFIFWPASSVVSLRPSLGTGRHSPDLDLAEAAWLPPYLIALGLGPRPSAPSAAADLIPFGWDIDHSGRPRPSSPSISPSGADYRRRSSTATSPSSTSSRKPRANRTSINAACGPGRATGPWRRVRRDNPASIARACGQARQNNPTNRCRWNACRRMSAARHNCRSA